MFDDGAGRQARKGLVAPDCLILTNSQVLNMRVTETAHWLEWQSWADPILRGPYKISVGQLQIPDVPGVGLEWDEDAVAANTAKL